MLKAIISRLPLLLALLLLVGAAPALAQGNGNGKAKKAQARASADEVRPQLQRRDVDDRDDDWYDDSWEVTTRRQGVPPGWCRGRGNPHNTVENCGYASTRTGSTGRNASFGGYRTYEEAHAAFHRNLDRKYDALIAERPLDVRRQLELRAQKSAEHNRWHAEIGRRHS